MDPYAAGPNFRQGGDDEEKRGLDYLLFVARSVRRHWLVAAICLAACAAAAKVLLPYLPKTYNAQTQILARRQQMLPSLARPSLGEESPTAAAFEIVHRRDNLVAIAQKAALLRPGERAPAAPEDVQLTDEERLARLPGRIAPRLSVRSGDGTLTISIDWPDPHE